MESSKGVSARKYRGKAAILKVLQDQAASSLNIASYCAAHGIAKSNFHRWLRKYGEAPEIGQVGFTPLQIVPEAGLFATVGSIRIYQPVSAAYLKELL
jgi:hypothetical protein